MKTEDVIVNQKRFQEARAAGRVTNYSGYSVENSLQGQPGELHMTIQVTRAATGKTETFELIGKVVPEDTEEKSDGGNTQHSS